jgi:hypothetical protein
MNCKINVYIPEKSILKGQSHEIFGEMRIWGYQFLKFF